VRGRNLKARQPDRFRVNIRRLRPSLDDEAEKRVQCRVAAEVKRVEGKRTDHFPAKREGNLPEAMRRQRLGRIDGGAGRDG